MVYKTVADLRKGDRVLLRNGWEADVADNKRGGVYRMLKVYGFETEIGSVYNTDIAMYRENGGWLPIGVSAKDAKALKMRQALGF